jgi:hypothetical protein
MESIGERISIEKSTGAITIYISAAIQRNKKLMLMIWLVLWTLCGIIVMSQFFTPVSKEVKLFMGIWFIFWIYFEYKIGYAYLWRKAGREIIKIGKEHVTLKKDINGSGKEHSYLKENMRDVRLVEMSSKNFARQMNSSFWVVGGETILFDYLGKTISFGMQLSEMEAQQVLRQLKIALKAKL